MAVSVVPLQSQSHCVTSHFDRSDEANAEHSSDPASSVLHEGARTDHPAGAYDSQPRTIWSNHNRCPAHTPAKRDNYVQLVWDLNGPLFGAPTTHPYRSTASVQYNPGERPNASSELSPALDSGPGATVTFAQRTDTGGGNDRPYSDPWTSGLQPQENNNDYSETENYLPSPPNGFSASSSPALVRFADGPDSSSGEPVATDLSAASNATPELAETDTNSDKGGVTTELVRRHVPPNINVEHVIKQSVIPGVKRVSDTLRATPSATVPAREF